MRRIFVTGTDTDVGKTVVSKLLLQTLGKHYKKCLGFKPISAGCQPSEQGLRNDDALILQAASNLAVDYHLVNPIAYEPPIAPHIAALEAGDTISLNRLQDCLEAIQAKSPEFLLIEGAGGWRLPLNQNKQYLSDFVIQNQIPVLLVVGMRLGCLNHALLTYQSIERDGLPLIGWIANSPQSKMPYYEDNLSTLQQLIDAPLLAEVDYDDVPKLKTYPAFNGLMS